MEACSRWTDALAAWRLPQELLDAAPENPYSPPVALLSTAPTDPLDTPTGQRVAEALGGDGVLLDVGCGAGRFCAAFVGGHRVVGVERQERLWTVAAERGVEVVVGTWPDIDAPVADVLSCTHVLYDVQEPAPFLAAMPAHARTRIVFELTDRHPWAGLGPLYRHFHDLDRPTGPTAALAAEMITEVLGVSPKAQQWTAPVAAYPSWDELVAHRRRQLCLPATRDAELAALLDADHERGPDGLVRMPPQPRTTLWVDL